MPTPVLKPADNGVYYAFWSDKRRSRRKSMGTSNLADAEKRFAQWLALGLHRGGQASEDVAQILTTAELWAIYDEKHVQKEVASPKSIERNWANLAPHFGDLTPNEIDQDIVDDYEDKRAEGEIGRPSISATVRKELVSLRACFGWHADPKRGKRKLLDKRDIPDFTLPDESAPRDRWLRTEEITKVMAAAKALHPGANRMSRGERFLWLALETAARKQAIVELKWDRVDFEIGFVDYNDPGARKTKKRRSVVPISKTLLPVLKQMYAERVNEYVLDNQGPIWGTVQVIVERAGLAAPRAVGSKPKATGISPHTFRHTAATHMARRGVPLYDIAGILGNSLAMIEKVYAKHCPDRLRAAVNSISSGFLEAAE